MSKQRTELLAQSIETSHTLFVRFLTGFSDENRTTQAENLPNHAVWCLGHCALTMFRAADRFFDGGELPPDLFITGEGKAGNAEQFDTESVSFNSTPTDDPDMYPSIQQAKEIFAAACTRLAAAIRDLEDARLDQDIPFLGGEMPRWKLIQRLCFHNATHAGQLTDLRRALKLGNVIG